MVVIRASQKKWAQRAHFVQLVKCGVGRIAPETSSDRRKLRGGLGGNGPRRRGAAGRREARTQGAPILVSIGRPEDTASRRSSAPQAAQSLFRQVLLCECHKRDAGDDEDGPGGSGRRHSLVQDD